LELFKVITIFVNVEGATAPKIPSLITTEGVALGEKNPEGNERVMLLFTESSPPAVGVKDNVTTDPALPATRSPLDMAKDVLVTRSPIGPDGVPKEGLRLTLVDTKIPRFVPENTSVPMVSPERVTETVVLLAIAAAEVVITIQVAVGAADEPCAPPLIDTKGVAFVLKKAAGYIKVIVLPVNIGPVAANENKAEAPDLPEARSLLDIENEIRL